jgi:hypothetical protein
MNVQLMNGEENEVSEGLEQKMALLFLLGSLVVCLLVAFTILTRQALSHLFVRLTLRRYALQINDGKEFQVSKKS